MEVKTEFPDYFLRGLSNKNYISNGMVVQDAFQFVDFNREDNKRELSINWLDDEEALTNILSQRKDSGKLQFPAGVAKLEMSTVMMVLANLKNAGYFSYERSPLPNNIYHGNLLLDNSVEKPIRLLAMNGLALAAGTNIIEQKESLD